MSIVHVHGNHVPGLTEGVSRNVDALVRTLRDQGEDAHLAAACNPLEAMNRRSTLLAGTLRVRHLATRAMADPRVHVVHCHVSLPSLAALARPLRPGRRPLVVHAWNAAFEAAQTPRLPGRALHRLVNGGAAARAALDACGDVVVSSRHQEAQLESLGVRARVHRIPNGVDTVRFRPGTPHERAAARARFGLGPGPVLLYYGHLSAWKGWDTFVASLPALLRAHPDAQALLSVTGYGGDQARVQELLHRHGVEGCAVVTGPAHVPDLHAAADVAVVPLRAAVGTACHPNVLLESMAAGLPVVASRVGSIPEVIADGQTGLLVAPGDAEELAQACGRLLDFPSLRARLGQAAREAILQRHTWPQAGRSLRRLYASMGVPLAPQPAPALAPRPLETLT